MCASTTGTSVIRSVLESGYWVAMPPLLAGAMLGCGWSLLAAAALTAARGVNLALRPRVAVA